jgi:hypothetical protein
VVLRIIGKIWLRLLAAISKNLLKHVDANIAHILVLLLIEAACERTRIEIHILELDTVRIAIYEIAVCESAVLENGTNEEAPHESAIAEFKLANQCF